MSSMHWYKMKNSRQGVGTVHRSLAVYYQGAGCRKLTDQETIGVWGVPRSSPSSSLSSLELSSAKKVYEP